jgi:hypothetical protein
VVEKGIDSGASFSDIFLPHGFRKFRKKTSENHDFGRE